MVKTIVISAINFSSGGPLSILKDSLSELSKSYASEYRIIALVHNKKEFLIENIEFRAYPLSKKSWLIRMFYEYIYFYFLSIKVKPSVWLSLHDITPNVRCPNRIVYCHNPSPFYNPKKNDWYKSTKVFLFSKFYRYLYRINIKKNKYVIVQQNWLRDYFRQIWNLKNVIVAYPEVEKNFLDIGRNNEIIKHDNDGVKFFFYPSFPRPFKNFELICEAYSLLSERYRQKSKFFLTLDGNLNSYAYEIVKKYQEYKGLIFLGLLSRDEVYSYYQSVDCLIFPSKLETWGLPITEFKTTGKPILLSNKPYAKETLGDYDKVSFFDVDSAVELQQKIEGIIDEKIVFTGNKKIEVEPLFTQGWSSLFKVVLNGA